MRRVLVPLDGSPWAESILPDARRLAGPDGELILVREESSNRYDGASGTSTDRPAAEEVETYLARLAAALRTERVRVRVERLSGYDAAVAIDAAAIRFKVDMIACATHGRSPYGRMLWGNVAWRALTRSPVPVLLRHAAETESSRSRRAEPVHRRILVPLDGSDLAERVLPLADELARDWKASIELVQVIPDVSISGTPYRRVDVLPHVCKEEVAEARSYLHRLADRLAGDVDADVVIGPSVVDALVDEVARRSITDVVIATHGRTGLSRAIVGSIADELIQRLRCPVVVVPVLAALDILHYREPDEGHVSASR